MFTRLIHKYDRSKLDLGLTFTLPASLATKLRDWAVKRNRYSHNEAGHAILITKHIILESQSHFIWLDMSHLGNPNRYKLKWNKYQAW